MVAGGLAWSTVAGAGMLRAEVEPVSIAQAECDFGAGSQSGDAEVWPVVHIVLSPRMPYALQEWRRMAAAAHGAGFRVLAWRDPRLPDAEWQAAVAAAGLPELRDAPALELSAAQVCGVLNHAPAAIVSRCGQGHAWPILGVMPDRAWVQLLHARRADLEAVPCS